MKFLSTAALALPLAAAGWPAPTLAHDDHDSGRDHSGDNRGPGKSHKVVLISLDGAKPDFIQHYLDAGVLPRDGGLGRVSRGVVARRNETATPSLTAVSHIAIATGSTSVHNDIPSNTFQAIAAPITSSVSGFAAAIGGYELSPLAPSPDPTAEPLWVRLRQAGKKVVAATWAGADGADISINGTVVQPAQPTRTVDYTVPFGAFGGIGAVGFSLTSASFSPDNAVTAQLQAAGRLSFSPILATAPFETFTCSSGTTATCSTSTATTSTFDLKFEIRAAALDTTNDGKVNYDTLVFFENTQGITRGPFHAPSTGPAFVKFGAESAPFFFEGTGSVVGAGYFITALAPDLSTVRFVRYGANFIPRNAAAIDAVNDINNNVGFWRPQDDFRIPERLSPGFTDFPDVELEAAQQDQVKTFVRYQADIAIRAMKQNPDADLTMVYIEQPDGSEHQYLLTDRRQATNPLDATSIGNNQDNNKIARYRSYVEFAYQQADEAVKRVMDAAGSSADVFVVSDHGFTIFHTSVSLTNILRNAGIDTSKVAIRTSGPAANIYVNLQNRESGGTVDLATYRRLVTQITNAVKNATDPNPKFNFSLNRGRLFPVVETRPLQCNVGTGLCTSKTIGQDFGDVFALLAEGYNFDGIQTPGVARIGDAPFDAATTELSVSNFYGAHGYDPSLADMSATFLAAGPDIADHKTIPQVRNIDVAPTILKLLGVRPSKDVDGKALDEILR